MYNISWLQHKNNIIKPCYYKIKSANSMSHDLWHKSKHCSLSSHSINNSQKLCWTDHVLTGNLLRWQNKILCTTKFYKGVHTSKSSILAVYEAKLSIVHLTQFPQEATNHLLAEQQFIYVHDRTIHINAFPYLTR